MTNFGISFKKARESRGLSIAQIAEETRISARFLEAIENEDFQILPGGIFNRGFVRTYASSIGLDPDAAVTEYEQLQNIHQPQPEQVTAPSEPPAPQAPRSERNFYAPLAIGGLALAIVIFYAVTREKDPASPTVPTAVPLTEQVASTPVTPAVSPTPEPGPAAAPSSAITLDVQATHETWIKVNADGNNVSPGELLEPGVTRHFTAHTSLNIIIGNAGGLNLKLNDQTVKAIGEIGQVRQIVLTPDNLKDFIEQ
jgi:cytoskeleton protein RodZ